MYAQAFDALKAGSYSIAITGFKDFLSTYPTSSLAENAQYWLGESYYVTHDYGSAAGAFRTVLKKYPDSRKAPDAMLKLGYHAGCAEAVRRRAQHADRAHAEVSRTATPPSSLPTG